MGHPHKTQLSLDFQLFHDGMLGIILSNGDTSTPYNISNAMKQGSVLVPVLFNLFITCIMNQWSIPVV